MHLRTSRDFVALIVVAVVLVSCGLLTTQRVEDPPGVSPGDKFALCGDALLAKNGLVKRPNAADVKAYLAQEPEWRERRKRYEGVLEAGTTIEYRKAIAIPDINTGAVVQHLGRVLPPSPWAGKTVMLDAVLFPDGHGRPYSTNFVAKLSGQTNME